MAEIVVDVWLYGSLAVYGGEGRKGSHANTRVHLAEGGTLTDLFETLKMDTKERGITFINGQLSAMPGLQPDLGHVLSDGDRVGLFDLRSMWPFQYRHGAAMTEEMRRTMDTEKDSGLHLSWLVVDKAAR